MGWGNFFDPRNRSYFGLKFAYDTIPNELVPFDYDTFEAYSGQVEAVVTNLQTGRAEYREVPRRDASFLLLQATCAMPVLFQPIRLDDGAPYLDGGCSDAIPWKRALAVGCDRVAANGDTANKIGTSGVAILAKHYGIPVYVLGPTSTIDMACPDGDHIPIEERHGEEIKTMWYEKPMALPEVKCYNPAFDVTDHELIAGIVTEKGICRPPYTKSLKALFDDKK